MPRDGVGPRGIFFIGKAERAQANDASSPHDFQESRPDVLFEADERRMGIPGQSEDQFSFYPSEEPRFAGFS